MIAITFFSAAITLFSAAVTFFAWRNGRIIKETSLYTQDLIKETSSQTQSLIKETQSLIKETQSLMKEEMEANRLLLERVTEKITQLIAQIPVETAKAMKS